MTSEQSNQLEALYTAAIVNKTINLNPDNILWNNSIPDSDIGSTTISLDLSQYQAILVKVSSTPAFILLKVDPNDTSCPYPNEMVPGNVGYFNTSTTISRTHCYGRGFRASKTGLFITAGLGYNVNTGYFETLNSIVKPLVIYGIKSVSLNI